MPETQNTLQKRETKICKIKKKSSSRKLVVASVFREVALANFAVDPLSGHQRAASNLPRSSRGQETLDAIKKKEEKKNSLYSWLESLFLYYPVTNSTLNLDRQRDE